VNPYDIQGVAAALSKALQMSREQQQVRMQRMREVVGHNNIFSWCRMACAIEAPTVRQGYRTGALQHSGRMAQYAARAV
jgi:trehalose-6-phosphate synthase